MLGCLLPNPSTFLPRGELCLGPTRFRSFELINYESQARDASPLINAPSTIKETYDGSPQESGSFRFETTMECHVALDVHAILLKWNSYHFVSRPLPLTPGKFCRKV